MKLLVTGGGGFLGQALCRGLVERGHEVTGGAILALAAAHTGGWLQAPLVAAFLSFSYLWFRAASSESPPQGA